MTGSSFADILTVALAIRFAGPDRHASSSYWILPIGRAKGRYLGGDIYVAAMFTGKLM